MIRGAVKLANLVKYWQINQFEKGRLIPLDLYVNKKNTHLINYLRRNEQLVLTSGRKVNILHTRSQPSLYGQTTTSRRISVVQSIEDLPDVQ